MAPSKKPAGKTSAPVAKAKAVSAKQPESKEIQWVRGHLATLKLQSESGPSWLKEPHDWHETQLEELLERLGNGSITSLPDELQEGVGDYCSQFDDQDVSEDVFYIDRELYSEVLAPLPEEKPSAPYVRTATSNEALECVSQLKVWEDATLQGMDKLKKLLLKYEGSAEVQEVGLARLGALLAKLREDNTAHSALDGRTPKVLTPIVIDAMHRHPLDTGVQRVACSVLRGIIVMDGGGVTAAADAGAFALIVSTISAHLANVDVCKMGAGALYAVVQKTDPKSQERLALRATDALEVLSAALQKHPYDLRHACEVTLPELKG